MRGNKFVILFAGVVGCSKTPIAHYLSWRLNLPIFSNDAIRTEVLEDSAEFVPKRYVKMRDQRLNSLLRSGISFIYDASVDREWARLMTNIQRHGYQWFIISLNLSRRRLRRLHQLKGYHESAKRLDQLIADHELFLKKFPFDAGLHISDREFPRRLTLAHSGITPWLKKMRFVRKP